MLQLYYTTLSDLKKIVLILQKRKSNKLKTTQIFKLQCNIWVFFGGGGCIFAFSEFWKEIVGELVSALSAKHFVFLSTSKISNFPPPLINKPGFLGVIHVWTNRSNFFYIGKSVKNCITLLSNRVLPYFLSSVFFSNDAIT